MLPLSMILVEVEVLVYIHSANNRSVPITTNVVSSNYDQGEVYNIIW
jgi:hypothetical protein